MLSGRKLPISNVVFVNGALDPWKPASITQDLSPDATAIYIEGEFFVKNENKCIGKLITVVSKMHNNRAILFSLKQVNNGKCNTAVRGSLGCIPV